MTTQGLTDTTAARGVPLAANARLPLGIVLLCGLAASVLPLSSDGPPFLLAVAAGVLAGWLIWRFIGRGRCSANSLGRTFRALGMTAIVLGSLCLALAVVRWTWDTYYAPPPVSIAIGAPGAREASALSSHHHAIMRGLAQAQLGLFAGGLLLAVAAPLIRSRPEPR